MQVNQSQIKRPRLIEPFFNEDLTPDNNFVTYIDCTTNALSAVHKSSATSKSHNIKEPLKDEYISRAIDNTLVSQMPNSIVITMIYMIISPYSTIATT